MSAATEALEVMAEAGREIERLREALRLSQSFLNSINDRYAGIREYDAAMSAVDKALTNA